MRVDCYDDVIDPRNGAVLIPKHWRLIEVTSGQVLGSGPYASEPLALGLVEMAKAFIKLHPREAHEIMAKLAHTIKRVQVLAADGAPVVDEENAILARLKRRDEIIDLTERRIQRGHGDGETPDAFDGAPGDT